MSDSNPFADAPVISVYTAEEAVADGVLLHFAPATAAEAGYHDLPVLLTRGAYEAAVQWTREDDFQSEDARFWDVLTVIRPIARTRTNEERSGLTHVYRVPNVTASGAPSRSETAGPQPLRVTVEGYDATGRACIIVSLPGED